MRNSSILRRTALAAAVGAVLICVHDVSAVDAATLTYKFDLGTSIVFEDGASGSFFGTFTIDPPGNSFSAEDLIVHGGAEAGTYLPLENDNGTNLIYAESSVSGAPRIDLVFVFSNLNAAPPHSDIDNVIWSSGLDSFTVDVSGGVTLLSAPVTAPEASTWAMMLIGLAGLGFAGLRRKRRGSFASA
jgi:PEP-CTERM motif